MKWKTRSVKEVPYYYMEMHIHKIISTYLIKSTQDNYCTCLYVCIYARVGFCFFFMLPYGPLMVSLPEPEEEMEDLREESPIQTHIER